MTKKDFEAIAAVIEAQRGGRNYQDSAVVRYVLHNLTADLCAVCAADSAKFDKARFLKACGV